MSEDAIFHKIIHFGSSSIIEQKLGGVLDRILAQGDEEVLIVSHAARMIFLQKELRKRGFTGDKFGTSKNGKLYQFER